MLQHFIIDKLRVNNKHKVYILKISAMKKIVFISMSFLLIFGSSSIFAQKDVNINFRNWNKTFTISDLEAQKEIVKKQEKERLKTEIQEIDERLSNNELTPEEADVEKAKAAEKRAKNIQNQLDVIDGAIELINRNQDNEYYSKLQFLTVKNHVTSDTITIVKKTPRTRYGTVLSVGLNNIINSQPFLDSSPFKIGGSYFSEIGMEFRTSLVKSGFLRLNYGLSFQFNSLSASSNQYFVNQNNQVFLDTFPQNLNKSKLRMNYLVLPVHFEIGKNNNRNRPSKFKFGLGGYLGVNLKTSQKLKYTMPDGERTKNKTSNNFNTNNLIYGADMYIGYDHYTLYVKYDINTIFTKGNDFNGHNISVGIRFIL